jgi:arsenite methyltransferase
MKLVNVWAYMLNNRAKKDSTKIIDALQIKADDVIVDIGAGGGFYTFQFAKKVGEKGKVFAVDSNIKLLNYINMKIKLWEIQNVHTVIGNKKGFSLPAISCDLIFMRNAFHHISDAVTYFQNLKMKLNLQGRIAIIEWSPTTKDLYVSRAKHFTPESKIYQTMKTAGFHHIETYKFLDKQSFNVFKIDG